MGARQGLPQPVQVAAQLVAVHLQLAHIRLQLADHALDGAGEPPHLVVRPHLDGRVELALAHPVRGLGQLGQRLGGQPGESAAQKRCDQDHGQQREQHHVAECIDRRRDRLAQHHRERPARLWAQHRQLLIADAVERAGGPGGQPLRGGDHRPHIRAAGQRGGKHLAVRDERDAAARGSADVQGEIPVHVQHGHGPPEARGSPERRCADEPPVRCGDTARSSARGGGRKLRGRFGAEGARRGDHPSGPVEDGRTGDQSASVDVGDRSGRIGGGLATEHLGRQ